MNKVFLEIGGNLGNKLENINSAHKLISEKIGQIKNQSSIYETPPWGFESSDNFYNQVLEVETELNPYNLLDVCNKIEDILGRIRGTEQFISRTMDIDILLFNNEVINDVPTLQIPHSRIHLRKFVLVPLAELIPQFIHPILKKSIEQLLLECKDNSKLSIIKSK